MLPAVTYRDSNLSLGNAQYGIKISRIMVFTGPAVSCVPKTRRVGWTASELLA